MHAPISTIRIRRSILSTLVLLLLLHLPFIADGLNQTCTLCDDGSYPADEAARYRVSNKVVLNCSQMYVIAPTLTNDTECKGIQAVGRTICQCNPEKKVPCKLCSDGSSLPDPDAGEVAGRTCADLEERAANDFASNCPAWQSTAGVYCNCPSNVDMEKRCDICPGEMLPDPFKTVTFVDGKSKTCLELEIDINRSSGNCGQYQQLYAEQCGCFDSGGDSPDVADDAEDDQTSSAFKVNTSLLLTMLVFVVCCVFEYWG